ncbi:MAG TPA: hypothetical protein GX013_10560 [Propionibacterium sp.]|nr:hypothetical protein [Propionibacterium sp.]
MNADSASATAKPPSLRSCADDSSPRRAASPITRPSAATGQAAAKLLKGFDRDAFEWLRLVRNATAYGSDKHPPAGLADLEDAWAFFAEINDLLEQSTVGAKGRQG